MFKHLVITFKNTQETVIIFCVKILYLNILQTSAVCFDPFNHDPTSGLFILWGIFICIKFPPDLSSNRSHHDTPPGLFILRGRKSFQIIGPSELMDPDIIDLNKKLILCCKSIKIYRSTLKCTFTVAFLP